MTAQAHEDNGTGSNYAAVNLNGNGQSAAIDNGQPSADGRHPAEDEQQPVLNRVQPPCYAQIIGWGYEVPERVVTNQDLERIVDTKDEWIRTRTGIEERRVVTAPEETSASLGTHAARKALEVADVHPSKVDLIICATSSPEHIFPSTASIIQDNLGITHAGAFDLSAACSGFVYALSIARGQILAGDAEYVLVVGAETLSRMVDWTDRTTCVLFGDGAGAVLLAASDVPGGVTASVLGSDGSGAELLMIPAGGSAAPASLETVSSGSHYIQMDGRAVFRFATRIMADATRQVLDKAGVPISEVDLVVPHQANKRIIQHSVLRQLQIPEDKVYVNVHKYGNTSTASIPIALCEAIDEGKVAPGDNLVFVGFGAGLTWGACAVKWSVPVEQPESTWWKNTQRQATYQAAAARSMWKRAVRRIYSQVEPRAMARRPQRSSEDEQPTP